MARFRRSSEDGSGPLFGVHKLGGCLENVSVTVYSGSGYSHGTGHFEVHLYDGASGASQIITESQAPFYTGNLYAHGGNSTEGHDINQLIKSGYCHVAMTGSGAIFGNRR